MEILSAQDGDQSIFQPNKLHKHPVRCIYTQASLLLFSSVNNMWLPDSLSQMISISTISREAKILLKTAILQHVFVKCPRCDNIQSFLCYLLIAYLPKKSIELFGKICCVLIVNIFNQRKDGLTLFYTITMSVLSFLVIYIFAGFITKIIDKNLNWIKRKL